MKITSKKDSVELINDFLNENTKMNKINVQNSLKRRITNWSNKLTQKVKVEIEQLAKDGSKKPEYTLYLCKASKGYSIICNKFLSTSTATNFLALENNIDELNGQRCISIGDFLYEDDFDYD